MPRRLVLLPALLLLAACTAPAAPADTRAPAAKEAAVPPAWMYEQPSEEDCAQACEHLLRIETEGYRGRMTGVLAEPEAAPRVEALLEGLRARFRPHCVERCRKNMSKAVTACVLATEDVARAVDCLDRTGETPP